MTIRERIEAENAGLDTSYGYIEDGVKELSAQLTRVLALVEAVGNWVNGDDTPPNDCRLMEAMMRAYDDLEKHGDIEPTPQTPPPYSPPRPQ